MVLIGAITITGEAGATTLILVTNTVAGRQWKRELIARTSLTEEEIGEYSGERKEIRPVTIATYQVITRRTKGEYKHLELFDSRDWGLIIYDEVHLLPAPVFKLTAELQARRRLGLTATLIPMLALPVSIIGTFAGMYVMGYSIDNLSLLALKHRAWLILRRFSLI